ncbi:thioesterase II family protein [Streptomyces lunalinharesii]|uniref:thioesterase II family protein n=1 Tax=Streptomyces lunalinharesii TaxID=333384 RepID=UPI0031D913BA
MADPVCEVVCFPHAGGGSSAFRTWHRHAARTKVTAVQLPGREDRLGERPHREMAALIAELAAAAGPLTGRPYAFYGHSMGALVAFELTRALRESGLPLPVALFVAGRDAPQFRDSEQVHHLPRDELLGRLRAWDGLGPADLPEYAEVIELMLPTTRADLTLAETYRYRPGPPLPVPVRVLRGARDPLVRAGDAGWAGQTSVDCAVREFAGGHFFVQDHESGVVVFVETTLTALLSKGARTR